MKVLINFNDYLGGGETLLLRLAQQQSKKCLVITSDNSYIKNQLEKEVGWLGELHVCPYNTNFPYLSDKEKKKIVEWLVTIFNNIDKPIQIITFCLRDLHIISETLTDRGGNDISLVHLLLHPLDHLYLGQTILDKLLLKFFRVNKFNAKENLKTNANILSAMDSANAIIPMNLNVVKRLYLDTRIRLSPKSIIPLPFLDGESLESIRVVPLINNEQVKIVWLGRIVDFKLPAILTMIDFISEHKSYRFDIVGYGNEGVINKYIEEKSVASRVKIVGKIPHSELKNKLACYHIGYGMGTSMAELTLCGLPVIVALASPDFHTFNRQISAGLVYKQGLGNVGDDLYSNEGGESNFPTIHSLIIEINENRQKCLDLSLRHIIKEFSMDTNMKRYDEIIESASMVSFKNVSSIKVSYLRKLLFKVFS